MGGLKLAVTLIHILLILSVKFLSSSNLLDASRDLKRFCAVYGTGPMLKWHTGVAQVGILERDHLETCKEKCLFIVNHLKTSKREIIFTLTVLHIYKYPWVFTAPQNEDYSICAE